MLSSFNSPYPNLAAWRNSTPVPRAANDMKAREASSAITPRPIESIPAQMAMKATSTKPNVPESIL